MSLKTSAKIFVARTARRVLEIANIDPELIKAMIRKPPTVHGGPRARRWPWPRRRHFDQREKRAVVRVINREIRKGGAIIYGSVEERAYCQAFADYLGGGYADAVNSGTNAVYVALRALDLEPGSEVIVPPITDSGGTMPVVMSNCIPVAADSDPGSFNSSVDQIRPLITDRTGAIIVAHIGGYPLDMDPIMELAAQRGIPVLEDCAQALGAVYKGRMAGSLGTISSFSTMFGKQHCTGGQGGVVFTKDTMLFARVRQIADRGKPFGIMGSPANIVASLNFNQDEISMAIGRVQLAKLPSAVQARRAFAIQVSSSVRGVDGVSVVGDAAETLSSPWFVMVKFDPARINCSAEQFATALANEGIGGVHAGYPFYPTDQPWHRDAVVFGVSGMPWALLQSKPRHFDLPNARAASKTIVRVEVHESLGEREAEDLSAAIKKVARHYGAAAGLHRSYAIE
jgi:perosamine synthetase